MLRKTKVLLQTSIRFQSTIGKPFTSKQSLIDFIQTPKVQIHETLVQTLTPIEISDSQLIKLMKLSSLQIPETEEQLQRYKIPLMQQIGFLSKIHNLKPEIFSYNYNQPNHYTKGLKLNDILTKIKQQTQDLSKGESESKAELLELATYTKNNHYIVKEGLLKNK
ncbi:hypothetical protein WICPIJ_005067 [Wickerhamomyces pijperi]|uniref:Glutamyl-tRNA(Gln) amidotransferase subunit F, mitochondrial n=1 Tax=Wickerhamomyces pijperi TaxID=599730 RepID=A0A9P8Q6P6_WICPI|nr:hypothetical protein WICPIJ_005067 [Wickerhamomyces pijperi]